MITIATNFLTVLAQTSGSGGGSTTSPANGPGGIGAILSSPMTLVFAFLLILMYFNFNSKRKQDKQRQVLLGAMKRGDRVQTIGGILGTIVEVRDADVVVKVDESNNTKIKFARSAVSKVITDDEKADAK